MTVCHAEQKRHRDRSDQQQLVEIDALNDRAAPLDRPVLLCRTVDVVLLSDTTEDEAQPDRGHQWRKSRRRPQPAVGKEFGGYVDTCSERHAPHQRDNQRENRVGSDMLHAENTHHEGGCHDGGQHEEITMGKVDQLDNAVDHGVAEGDQRVEQSVLQPDQD